ncbi:PepSY domain-containing protein [Sphingobium estronivorans]|uniref:PepSY domain-containing protein n=1 Tax=Sphingobium estronivorans TaxID=1577690 RepID=UPI0012396FBA|nr:PepSY domain-containing protein [Sphingobium estronivorans]
MRKIIITLAGMGLIASGANAAMKGANLAGQAKVGLAAARAAALKAHPGKITDEELEKEKGGSGLRYSFDISSGGKTFEVGVDAKTGKVLENAPEGKNPD